MCEISWVQFCEFHDEIHSVNFMVNFIMLVGGHLSSQASLLHWATLGAKRRENPVIQYRNYRF